jgi:hypothetical protein
MNCNNHYIGLGEVPVCSDAAILPLTADTTGTWAFMSSFNGTYQYTQFQCTAGQAIVVPIGLNEHYSYTFRLYKPNNTIFNDAYYAMLTIPFLNNTEHYLSDAPTTFTTGKVQHVATEGQTIVTYTALVNAKQVVVFVEGMLWQEGNALDQYSFSNTSGIITFNTPLISEQKISIIYFK